MPKRQTKDEFVLRSKAKFGNKFDYSNVHYINVKVKVWIRCMEHGKFEIAPEQHLRSQQGCPKCPLKNLGRKPKKQEKFINDAMEKYGEKFDYHLVEYINNKKGVRIICHIHGEFLQSPSKHLKGVYGCRKCAPKGTKLTNKEFISRAKAVHGERYDYSETKYTLNKNPINLICIEHGKFTLSSAGNHLKGHGCQKCPKITDVSTAKWIVRACNTHGNRYDYSQTEYLGANLNLDIVCKIHGLFSQIASHHERGSNCPKCAGRHSCSSDEFKEKCRKIHGGKYDYSNTVYLGAKSLIVYICSIHGNVSQQAYDHMVGYGCAQCAGKAKHTTEQWKELAIQMHGPIYDYSRVHYQGKGKEVILHCYEEGHGDFKLKAASHLRGVGCPKCSRTGFKPNKPGYLYLLVSDMPPFNLIKVGITGRLPSRIKDLESATPYGFKLLNFAFYEKGFDAFIIESQLKKFAKEHSLGVKFSSFFSGHSEWFQYSKDFVAERDLLVKNCPRLYRNSIGTPSDSIAELKGRISQLIHTDKMVSINIR